MARKTRAEISHKVTDVTAKTEAVYSLSDKLAASSYDQIKDEKYIVDSVATYEHNRWVLDGTMKLAGEETEWGLWSDSISDENGQFEVNPTLEAVFENSHTSTGITITFAGDSRPLQIAITWLNGETILAEQTYNIDAHTYFAQCLVENYDKVIIEFIGTTVPLRRLKVAEIDYGEIKVWRELLFAKVLEEANLTSSELTINTLTFKVHDTDMNMLNPTGAYIALQKKQRLNPIAYINGEPRQLGLFFLDTWKNTSVNVVEFEAYDAIGLFDGIQYIKSAMWSGTAASEIFASIFDAAGWTDYTVEEAVANELVYGYIPAVSVREALHQACFALRASCITNRDGSISIKRLPTSEANNPIEKDQKFGSQSIEQKPFVNSVSVKAYKFLAGSSNSQLYSGTLAAGTHTITFLSPASNLLIFGGAITESGVNYAIVNVTTSGTVTITGRTYTSQAQNVVYEIVDGARSQVTVQGIYLVSQTNAAALAEFLYNDYQRRIQQTFSLILEDEAVGNNVDVDTMLGARKDGVITSLDINLTGGFIADCEVRG